MKHRFLWWWSNRWFDWNNVLVTLWDKLWQFSSRFCEKQMRLHLDRLTSINRWRDQLIEEEYGDDD